MCACLASLNYILLKDNNLRLYNYSLYLAYCLSLCLTYDKDSLNILLFDWQEKHVWQELLYFGAVSNEYFTIWENQEFQQKGTFLLEIFLKIMIKYNCVHINLKRKGLALSHLLRETQRPISHCEQLVSLLSSQIISSSCHYFPSTSQAEQSLRGHCLRLWNVIL